jgi:hypothetical protein
VTEDRTDERDRGLMTVKLSREVYERYKERAIHDRYAIGEYLNQLLRDWLDKEEFISRFAAHLSTEDFDENLIILKDMKERKIIEVYLKDSELQCEFHKSTNCIHTKFAWSRPELGRITRKRHGEIVDTGLGDSGEGATQSASASANANASGSKDDGGGGGDGGYASPKIIFSLFLPLATALIPTLLSDAVSTGLPPV